MIAARDLWFSYGNASEELFSGLTRSFERGAVTAVVGPSGSGKSTLLFVLGLLLAPRSGHVELDGRAVSSMSDRHRSWVRATTVGFVFQDAVLDPSRTVIDNVVEAARYARAPRREAAGRALELLERFGVELRSNHLPGQISGGQAQRVALCRALINQPSVVLADEPTGNLDAISAGDVVDALQEAAADGAAVIIATHDPTVVERCDEVLNLVG